VCVCVWFCGGFFYPAPGSKTTHLVKRDKSVNSSQKKNKKKEVRVGQFPCLSVFSLGFFNFPLYAIMHFLMRSLHCAGKISCFFFRRKGWHANKNHLDSVALSVQIQSIKEETRRGACLALGLELERHVCLSPTS
jgi:hypothetical protein